MQERKRLEQSLGDDKRIAGMARTSTRCSNWRARAKTWARSSSANWRISASISNRIETAMLLSRRQRPVERHRHHPPRRRRHREPGLGRDAAAHVPALGRTQGLRNRDDGPAGGRRRRHQVRHLRSQRRERLRPAAIRDRRAPPGAHFAVRRQRAAAHLVSPPCSSTRRWTTRSRSTSSPRICASIRSAPAAPAASTSTAPIRRSA